MNILAFGEVMLRFTVADKMMLEQSDNLNMTTVGTGVNLLSSLAHFGYDTSILTVLPDNPIGKKARTGNVPRSLVEFFQSDERGRL